MDTFCDQNMGYMEYHTGIFQNWVWIRPDMLNSVPMESCRPLRSSWWRWREINLRERNGPESFAESPNETDKYCVLYICIKWLGVSCVWFIVNLVLEKVVQQFYILTLRMLFRIIVRVPLSEEWTLYIRPLAAVQTQSNPFLIRKRTASF